MSGKTYRCPICGNTSIKYNYGVKKVVCENCNMPLKDFEQANES